MGTDKQTMNVHKTLQIPYKTIRYMKPMQTYGANEKQGHLCKCTNVAQMSLSTFGNVSK